MCTLIVTPIDRIKINLQNNTPLNNMNNLYRGFIPTVCRETPGFGIYLKANYNKENNMRIWNNNQGNININFLVYLLKCEGFETPLIPFYKAIENEERQPNVSFNAKYVSDGFSYTNFKDNKTIILQSQTGTGKTTAVFKYIKQIEAECKTVKMISIVSLCTLGMQQKKSLEDIGVNVRYYKNRKCTQPRLGNYISTRNNNTLR